MGPFRRLSLLILLAITAPSASAKQPRLDRYGDLLPEGAVARLGSQRWRHPGGVSALTFSPDGRHLLSAGCAGIRGTDVLCRWEVPTGKLVRRYATPRDFVSVAFSPDSRTLAAGYFAPLLLWSPRSGKELRRITDPPPYVSSLAYSPDGRTLAAASRVTEACRRWRVDTDEKLPSWTAGGGGGVLSFAPDGKFLAHAGNRALTVWDAANGKEWFWQAAPHAMALRAVAFSPDGRTLVTAASPPSGVPEAHTNGLRLWDVFSRKELRRFGGDDTTAFAVCFFADGRTLVSLSGDGVRLWELLTGRERGRIDAKQAGHPKRMALSPDGRLLALAAQDGTIRLWSATKFKELRKLRGHDGAVTALAFSPDGRLLASGSMDATVLVWDVAAGRHD